MKNERIISYSGMRWFSFFVFIIYLVPENEVIVSGLIY